MFLSSKALHHTCARAGRFLSRVRKIFQKFRRCGGTTAASLSYTALKDRKRRHSYGSQFKRNPAIAQSLLQSGDGQRLMQMLTSQDGGAALNHAAQNAAAGNTKELATMLSNLMKSPEGMAIMNRINDSAKK